jgi:ATP-binding cassette, subfamily B, multidrug efflux pump
LPAEDAASAVAGGERAGNDGVGDGTPWSGPPVLLEGVEFGYLPERPVLHGLSFTVAAGEHVALVGRTGAGKTSALALLAGLYAPWSGRVRVAGRAPRTIPEDERRHVVGVVPQAVHLFTGTVLENLTLFDPAVPVERVRRAAELTGAVGFVEALPQGFQTRLSGSRGDGAQLSAGQRQLLALTRAVVWQPRVLVLDEATAAIDGASDAAFRAALRRAARERDDAVLTVAHRLSTAREADRVLVLEAGRVVEEGTPQELVERGGRFAALVALEEAGLEWERGSLTASPSVG